MPLKKVNNCAIRKDWAPGKVIRLSGKGVAVARGLPPH